MTSKYSTGPIEPTPSAQPPGPATPLSASTQPVLQMDRRVLFFTGKGGVGKTSVVAAAAIECARQGRRPLVIELSHRASLGSVFGHASLGSTVTDLGEGVSGIRLDLERGLQDYFAEHIPVRRIAKAVAENRTLQSFFRAAPSVNEVVTLNTVAHFEEQREGEGFKWDPLLVDLDATGHALMLLSLPQVLEGLVGNGPMRKLVDRFAALLHDPKRSVLHLVSIPTELAISETIQLYRSLTGRSTGTAQEGTKTPARKNKIQIDLGSVIVNRMSQPLLSSEQETIAKKLQTIAIEQLCLQTAKDLEWISRRSARQRRERARVDALDHEISLPRIELPEQAEIDGEVLKEFGRRLGGRAS